VRDRAETSPAADPVARRFTPLVQVDEALQRPRLLALLGSAAPIGARLTLLAAPAGFGKTTVLAQMAQQARDQGAMVAWLNCDEHDKDAGLFTEDLQAALAAARPPAPGGAPPAVSLAGCLSALPGATLVCIDEYEAASSPEVDALVEQLARVLPAHVHLLLAGREPPEPVFTRLQLAGRARRIDAEALRFSRDEAMALLESVLPEREAAQVADYAQGWPFALQLARLRAAGQGGGTGTGMDWEMDPRARIPRRQVFDYLAREVIARLPAALRAFLDEVAVLDTVDPALADAVRGRDDSLSLIQQLVQLKPVVTLDEGHWRARLHPLLRDHLLDSAAPAAVEHRAVLHLRAAQHLAQRHLWHDAVGHAVAAGRLDSAAGLIEQAGAVRLFANEGALRTRLLLGQLPEASLRRHPRLRLLRLGHVLAERNPAGVMQEFNRVESLLREDGSVADPAVHAELELTRCMLLIHSSERDLRFSPWSALAEGRRLGRAEALTDARMLAIVLALELLFLHRYGPHERAERRTREIEQLHAQGAYTFNSPWLWAYRARNALAQGQLDEAERTLLESLPADAIYVNFRQDSLGQLVQALLGRIAWLRGDAEAAAAHLTPLREAAPMLLLEIQAGAHVDAALAEHAMGRGARALEMLEAARELADDEDLVQLGLLAAAAEVELAARDGDLRLAQSTASGMALDALWLLAQAPFALPWICVEALGRARFHLHLAQDEPSAAVAVAQALMVLAQGAGQRVGELTALALQARALLGAQGPRQAQPLLDAALALGAETGAMQPFLALGAELMTLLRQGVAGARPPAAAPARRHAERLLALWEDGFRARTQRAAASTLTPREIDVLCALAVEQGTKLVARRLLLSPETVKHHLKNIYGKLGVRTRDEALAEARRRALMP
jgi:ATP/maltotriose-dependent transcriptional regulator MalT